MLGSILSPLIIVLVLWCQAGFSLLTGDTINWYEWFILAAATTGYGGYYIYILWVKD